MDYQDIIIKQLEDGIALKKYLQSSSALLGQIAAELVQVLSRGNKVVLFGNGGSAADAQHIAGELVGRFYINRPALPAINLAGNVSILTAIANDFSYADIFERQVEGLVKPGDAAIGLSTSGNSENVIRGILKAKSKGAVTIGFSGSGGKLKDLTDYALAVPSSDTPRIQEAHITAGHIICYIVEDSLFGQNASR